MLSNNVNVIRDANAAAAGITAVNGSVIDMGADGGWDDITGIALLNALTATQATSLKCQQGTLANGSDMADIAGAATANAADADSNKLLVLDVHKSLITMRYVRFVLNRGTANAALDGILAIQNRGKKVPPANDATVYQLKQAF